MKCSNRPLIFLCTITIAKLNILKIILEFCANKIKYLPQYRITRAFESSAKELFVVRDLIGVFVPFSLFAVVKIWLFPYFKRRQFLRAPAPTAALNLVSRQVVEREEVQHLRHFIIKDLFGSFHPEIFTVRARPRFIRLENEILSNVLFFNLAYSSLYSFGYLLNFIFCAMISYFK